jgi:hypothetical protein
LPETGPAGDCDPVTTLIALLVDLGMLTRLGQTVYATGHGIHAAQHPELMWRCVIEHVWGGDGFAEAVAELAFAILAHEGPQRESTLAQRIHPVLEPNWRDAEKGLPTHPDQTRVAIIRLEWIGGALGVVTAEGRWTGRTAAHPWPDRRLSLSELGVATGLQVLRHRAIADR